MSSVVGVNTGRLYVEYSVENNFKKHPMSKFCMDMMDDFKR